MTRLGLCRIFRCLPIKLRTATAIKWLPRQDGREKERPWLVYILRCDDGSLYTGITNDLPRRLAKHNAGTAARYTRCRLPVTLAYQEPQESRSHALKRELEIKRFSRKTKEALIHAAGPMAQATIEGI